jgi:hypothetical protein
MENGYQRRVLPRSNLRQLSEYIREGSVKIERNHVIKPLSSLHYFSEKVYTTRMDVYTGHMPIFCDNQLLLIL